MSVFTILAWAGAALAVLSGFLRWWVWMQAKKSGRLEEKLDVKLKQEALYRELNERSRIEDESMLEQLAGGHKDDGMDPDRVDEPWLRDRS